MYSNQSFWQVFHTIPYLNQTDASTLYTNYGAIGKFLHTFIRRIATYSVDKIIRSLNNWVLDIRKITARSLTQNNNSNLLKPIFEEWKAASDSKGVSRTVNTVS